MAIGAGVVWEVRTAGNELNGFGFVAGSAGTDFSQQDSKNTVGNNISTTDASVSVASTTVSSAGVSATAALVGNVVCLTGGTRTVTIDAADFVANGTTTITSATANWPTTIAGCMIRLNGGTGALIQQWYKIITYNSASSVVVDRIVAAGTGITGVHAQFFQVATQSGTSFTVDRVAAMTGTGLTLNVGGANSNIKIALLMMASSNKTFIKTGTYTTTVGFQSPTTNGGTSGTAPQSIIQGYGTTRGDSGRPTLQLSTNTGLTGISLGTSNFVLQNIIVDGASLGTSTGINTSAANQIINCKVINCTTAGVNCVSSQNMIFGCEISGCGAAATAAVNNNGSAGPFGIYNCYIHDNACPAISSAATGLSCHKNVIINNTGASSDGIRTSTSGMDSIMDNLIYGNGRHGINYNVNVFSQRYLLNNLICNNGGFGLIIGSVSGFRSTVLYDGNVYYNNTSGNFSNYANTAAQPNSVAPYTNANDVILSATPFVNAAGGDFRFNNNQYGTACKNVGIPRSWPGLTGNISYEDMGPFGHQDPGFAA